MDDIIFDGMYIIMRKLKGYTHFDFINDDRPFYCITFFELLKLIQREIDAEKKASKKGI